MVKVKICGITRLEDARLAVQQGAWALGFIFYPPSPRAVQPERVRMILSALSAEGLRPSRAVGVFVNSSLEEIRAIQAESGIDTVQLHGEEGPEFVKALTGVPVWKVFRLGSREQLPELERFQEGTEAFLFDAAVKGVYGGSGQVANWDLLSEAKAHKPMIVSGGLQAHNAREAYERLQPFALDLASGVEERPGIKDPEKIAALFKALGDLS